jgi:hypothetical protein
MVIKRVGPVSCGKIAGVLYGIIGLVMGAIFSVLALAGGLAADTTNGATAGAMVGVGAIVAFPLLYGGLGAIGTIIMAALYNVIAGVAGGIEIDVE